MNIFYIIYYYINPLSNSSNGYINVELYFFYINKNDYISYK